MDQDRVLVLPAGVHVHEAAQEDAAAVDDGDAGHERPAASAPHVAVGPAGACAPVRRRDAVQTQDGGDGAGRPAPSQLQDQPESERGATGERELGHAAPVARGVQGHRGSGVHRRTFAQRRSIHTGWCCFYTSSVAAIGRPSRSRIRTEPVPRFRLGR